MLNENGAKVIAKLAHKGQKYGNDDYYEAHIRPLVEMVRVAGGNRHAIVAAYLHDVVEDTDLGIDDLIYLDVPMEAVITIDKLTRNPDIEYLEYIKRIKANKNAVLIKKLDITLNLSNNPNPSLVKRYQKALEILNT